MKSKALDIFPREIDFRLMDYKLFTLITILTFLGLIFLYSASSAISYTQNQTTTYYFKKQLIWTTFSFFLMLFVIYIDLEKIRKYIPIIMIISIIALIVVLFMPEVQKTKRWIVIKFIRFQPSEIAKIAFILYLSNYIDTNYTKIKKLKYFLKPLFFIGIICFLIAIEPDLGTPFLIFMTTIILMFIYAAKIMHILAPLIISIPLIVFEIIRHPYRLGRIKTFLSPWEDPTKTGFQLVQSLVAIGNGGWFGKGPGNSIMKLNYLPESHTDFIFPVIAEELGFIGVSAIIILFLIFFIRSIKISNVSKNSFLSILTISSAILIIFQALFNIAMVSGMVPTKGLPLPFFSYGGSSIITTMILSGFILNTSIRRKKL